MGSYPLTNKVVLITGGGGGLGATTANRLASRGARVAVADIDGVAAKRVAAELAGASALGLQCDVTDPESVRVAVERTTAELGPVDVTIANAGILGRSAPIRDLAPGEMAKVLEVNVNGVLNTVSATIESVIARRGQMVVISSVYSYINGVGAVPYAMSKAAIEALGRGLNAELAGHGASVLTAYFALIDTGMIRDGVDASPGAKDLLDATAPSFLLKRISTATAAAGIVRGIEHRDTRLMLPSRWKPLAAMRGIVGPLLDRKLATTPAVHSALSRMETSATGSSKA
ncbi:SDR family NAD(P)-dependent oxidoreductase [Rhodococcus sp. 077-4]|uniref:SDR family NAD(P)-dependent oxidoreductase n=1 Tax=Rhodococcus sp. 077-4 TaxID=2789271 RepID=UPI0039F578F7